LPVVENQREVLILQRAKFDEEMVVFEEAELLPLI
jgi:hypothetical protein